MQTSHARKPATRASDTREVAEAANQIAQYASAEAVLCAVVMNELVSVLMKSGKLSASEAKAIFTSALDALDAAATAQDSAGSPVHEFMVTRLLDTATQHGIELRQ